MEISPVLIVQSVLPMYGLMILGGVLRKCGVLQRQADSSLMKLVINCLYPLLIIDKILVSESVRNIDLVAWAIPTGAVIIVVSILIAKALAAAVRIPVGQERNTFATTCGIQNYGFAAVPVIMALFPDDLLGVQFVHALGVDLALWTVGVAMLRGGIGAMSIKSALTGPVVAVIVGLCLVYSGAGDWVTHSQVFTPVMTITSWLGGCSFPIALMLVGASLSDELRSAVPTIKVGLASIAGRIVLLPALILGAIIVFPFPRELACVLIVQAAMPSAVMPIILAKVYGGHPATAVQVVITTQLLGIVTIPLWITLGIMIVT